jgi:hypothetical protein
VAQLFSLGSMTRMKKFLPHLVWLSGLVVAFIGLIVGPGVPYQDPTPAMRALEARQNQLCDRLAIIGLCLFVSGIAWVVARLIYRRFSRKVAT